MSVPATTPVDASIIAPAIVNSLSTSANIEMPPLTSVRAKSATFEPVTADTRTFPSTMLSAITVAEMR